MKKHPGLLQIHLAALLFGGAGLFGKFLALSPVTITLGRTVFGALALFLAARMHRVSLAVRSRREGLILFVCSALLAAHWFTFFQAIRVSSVAIGLLSYSSFPLFVFVLKPLFFREPWRPAELPLALLVTAGLVVVTPSLHLSDRTTQGLLWGLVSGLTFALLSLLNRSQVRASSPLAIAFYQNAAAALCLVPAARLATESWSPSTVLLLVALGVIFTATAHLLYIGSLRHIRAQLASVIICLEPIYGIVFAWLLLGEAPSARTLVGGALIFGGVFAATLHHTRQSPQTA